MSYVWMYMVSNGLVIMLGQKPDYYWVDTSSQKKRLSRV